MFSHTFLRSLLPPGNRNAVAAALVIHVLIDTALVRVATVAFDGAIDCFTHVHRLKTGNTLTASRISELFNINQMSKSTLNP